MPLPIRPFEELFAEARADAESPDVPSVTGPSIASHLHQREAPNIRSGLRIVREIARGGQACVYQAEQAQPRRTVAVKVVHSIRTPSQHTRFLREAEILSKLQNPNIVQVFEAGPLEGDEASYIVMEFVDGQPIDRYVANELPKLPELLRLFASACEGVHAAHRRGIIHRDIKPSNILVARDSQYAPIAKVLDFGLAKLLCDSSEDTLTDAGQFVGTIAWTSPEQADGRHDDVDTRSDVYSLGAVLHQLLTGRLPHGSPASPSELLKRVTAAEVCSLRRLNSAVPTDVDTIVLKCLSHDPARRYETAGELAAELRRYLAGWPVEARRDSIGYVARKFAFRHYPAIGAVCLVFFASIAIALVAYTSARSEHKLRVWAEREAGQAVQANAVAEREREKAVSANAQTEQIATQLIATLESMDVSTNGLAVDTPRSRRVLGDIRKALESSDSPRVFSALARALSKKHVDIGQVAVAQEVLESALRRLRQDYVVSRPEIAAVLSSLGGVQSRRGQHAAAIASFEEAILIYEALGRQLEIAVSRGNLAAGLLTKGDFASAERHYRSTIAFIGTNAIPECDELATILDGFGQLLSRLARFDEAMQYLRESLALRERVLEAGHLSIAHSQSILGSCLSSAGRNAEALPLLLQALESRRRAYRGDHAAVEVSLNNVGSCLNKLGRPEEALVYLSDSLGMCKRLYGNEAPSVAISLNNVAGCHFALGAPDKALVYHEASLKLRKDLGQSPEVVARAVANIAGCLFATGQVSEAADRYQEAISLWRSAFDGPHPHVAEALGGLARCMLNRSELQRASSLAREALDMYEQLDMCDHMSFARELDIAADCALASDLVHEAVQMRNQALRIREENLSIGHKGIFASEVRLGRALSLAGEFAKAEYTLISAFQRFELRNDAQEVQASCAAALYYLYKSWNAAEPSTESVQLIEYWRYLAKEVLESPDLIDGSMQH